MNPVDAYAQAVMAGEIPAGKYHRLACARHQRDRAREGSPDFPYRLNLVKAERFFRFASYLKHYKGEWAGKPFILEPWQLFRLGSVFGWEHVQTGLRRFRTAYNEVPRKNGKSLEAAVVALYTTFFDGERGAEGYTIATKRDQARIVWGDARQLVLSSSLKTRIAVQVANLHDDKTASKLEPLGADHDSTDGLNPHLIIVDEFHAHKTRGLIDVMETATAARRQPLNYQITTAGDDPVSPGGVQHDYACKILEQVFVDESIFVFIAHADEGDDWLDEATWRKANPNFGVSVNPEDMRALARKAVAMPAAAASFKQKRLNVWVHTSAPFLSIEGWRAGQTLLPTAAARQAWRDELLHERCYVGIDLASKIDLCALSLVFPPTETRPRWRLLQYLWTPAETVVERSRRDRAPYDIWVQQGWLLTTPGSRIDHAVVRQTIREVRDAYDIALIGFDPWHADTLIDELHREEGFAKEAVLSVPQTYQGMSSACLHMQAEILGGRVDAGGCPVTAWAVLTAVANRDGKDNLMFAKGKSRGRIDPLIAATIGMALWWRVREKPAEPAYQMLVI